MTRPIIDRVKQSLFDLLGVMGYLDGGNMLDIFAGTGSIGLEALSRGVDHCTFIERDRSARQLLGKNLETLCLTDQATVLGGDALGTHWIGSIEKQPVDLICCDPPYRFMHDPKSLGRIVSMAEATLAISLPDATLTLRTDKHTDPVSLNGWVDPETHHYGSMSLHFYRRDGS